MAFKRFLSGTAYHFDRMYDTLSFQLKKNLRLFEPCVIYPYMGYGYGDKIFVKGRVLEKIKITGVTINDTAWRNISNMFKRLETDEVKNAEIKISFRDQEFLIKTDEEGFFETSFKVNSGHLCSRENIFLEIISSPAPFTPGLKVECPVVVPTSTTDYIIVSDIDDTIMHTGAISLRSMFKNTFLYNAFSRIAFPGAAAFYRTLQKGKNGNNFNPIFYLSSSPWNIYDMLTEFINIKNFPEGPLILKDYGIEKGKFLSSGHLTHKYYQIKNLLQFYPDKSFILIGDSGQEDPSIYAQVIKDFPGRILAAYIRDVKVPERSKIVFKIQEEIINHKVPMILVENTLVAAKHAVESGYIPFDSLPEISEEKNKVL